MWQNKFNVNDKWCYLMSISDLFLVGMFCFIIYDSYTDYRAASDKDEWKKLLIVQLTFTAYFIVVPLAVVAALIYFSR